MFLQLTIKKIYCVHRLTGILYIILVSDLSQLFTYPVGILVCPYFILNALFKIKLYHSVRSETVRFSKNAGQTSLLEYDKLSAQLSNCQQCQQTDVDLRN